MKKESQYQSEYGDPNEETPVEFPVYPKTFVAQGGSQVWYWKDSYAMMAMGSFNNTFFQLVKDNGDLTKTHVLLGSVPLTNLDDIYRTMQGEIWSPEGEAREIITEKGLSHTSMSIGDVIVLPSGEQQMVMRMGFERIN